MKTRIVPLPEQIRVFILNTILLESHYPVRALQFRY